MWKREKVWVSYCDLDITSIFDFRGCSAPSLEELKRAIITEVQGTLQIDGSPPTEWDIKIYYKDLRETPEGVDCDAVALVSRRTMNRSPRYIK